ncbi:hypothetical protein PCE1_000091 [Barthelona sp. PCE]
MQHLQLKKQLIKVRARRTVEMRGTTIYIIPEGEQTPKARQLCINFRWKTVEQILRWCRDNIPAISGQHRGLLDLDGSPITNILDLSNFETYIASHANRKQPLVCSSIQKIIYPDYQYIDYPEEPLPLPNIRRHKPMTIAQQWKVQELTHDKQNKWKINVVRQDNSEESVTLKKFPETLFEILDQVSKKPGFENTKTLLLPDNTPLETPDQLFDEITLHTSDHIQAIQRRDETVRVYRYGFTKHPGMEVQLPVTQNGLINMAREILPNIATTDPIRVVDIYGRPVQKLHANGKDRLSAG